MATAVGSMPHKDAAAACRFIITNFKDIPFWPQLPKMSFNENMYVQYSEGFGAFTIDRDNKKIYLDRSKDVERSIEELYEHFLAGDTDYFKISNAFAAGLYALPEALGGKREGIKFIKGQIIGPVSLGLSVTDNERRALVYDNEIMNALLKLLAMKARWQIRHLAREGKVIMSLDEPYLASMGSAYTAVKKDDITAWLGEIIEAIHDEGALAAVHCCGNTDWPVLLGTEADIISFDAYNYSDAISLYPGDIGDFLARGGVLAWGIVPTSEEELVKENSQRIGDRLKEAFSLLTRKGIKRETLILQGLLTPSCGTGLLSEALAEKAHLMTCEVSARIKSRRIY